MPAPVFVDSCLFIDLLRGHAAALIFFQQLQTPPALSSVTVAELFAGARDDRERQTIDDLLAACPIIAVDTPIAKEAGQLRQRYHPSHGTGLADALIAACCQSIGGQFHTLNKRHFPMFREVVVPY